jgi:hypothetical protein
MTRETADAGSDIERSTDSAADRRIYQNYLKPAETSPETR